MKRIINCDPFCLYRYRNKLYIARNALIEDAAGNMPIEKKLINQI